MPNAFSLEYFLEQALDHEVLWTLEQGGQPLLMRLEDGREALPLFPRQEFAALEAADASEQPRLLELEDFVESGLPDLGRRGLALGVFPVKGVAWIAEPAVLQQRIWNDWDEED